MQEDYRLQRLYVTKVPIAGVEFTPDKPALHYLLHVLRLQKGQNILLFDGHSGEWRAQCVDAGKKMLRLRVEAQTRPQTQPEIRLVYCFAPLKQARLDYMVQKAVEMGATFLQPVITQHTQIHRLNTARLTANSIEAAEQCGLLNLAAAAEALPLAALLQNWPQQWGKGAQLIFADEARLRAGTKAETSRPGAAPAAAIAGQAKIAAAARPAAAAAITNPLPLLQKLAAKAGMEMIKGQNRPAETLPQAGRPAAEPQALKRQKSAPPVFGLLIGPEGGFSAAERRLLYAQDFVTAIPLGPRILRADTAATAALALIQATLGDWQPCPFPHMSH